MNGARVYDPGVCPSNQRSACVDGWAECTSNEKKRSGVLWWKENCLLYLLALSKSMHKWKDSLLPLFEPEFSGNQLQRARSGSHVSNTIRKKKESMSRVCQDAKSVHLGARAQRLVGCAMHPPREPVFIRHM